MGTGGNVGIGTDSPDTIIHAADPNGAILRLERKDNNVLSGDLLGGIETYRDDDDGAYIQTFIKSYATETYGRQGYMTFGTNDNNNGNATERMRIDSSGNVGIGTDSPASKFQVKTATNQNIAFNLISGGSLNGIQRISAYNDAATASVPLGIGATELYFLSGASSTERMRITSGGDVLVNNATAFSLATHDPDVITTESFGINNGSNLSTFGLDRIHFNSSNYFVLNASAVGVKLVSGATAWTAQSDESLKENIKPLENVLDKIKDYRCVEYNLKANNNKKIGFIAQDWENDFAPIVNKDDEGLLGMKYTETIPVLLKAIQELKAEVDLLKQECKCKN
jgi:hypothetical protein